MCPLGLGEERKLIKRVTPPLCSCLATRFLLFSLAVNRAGIQGKSVPTFQVTCRSKDTDLKLRKFPTSWGICSYLTRGGRLPLRTTWSSFLLLTWS